MLAESCINERHRVQALLLVCLCGRDNVRDIIKMFEKIIQLFTEQRGFKKLANKSKRYLQLGTLFRRIT